MSEIERPDQEPKQQLLVPAPGVSTSKGLPSLANVRRELSDEEFSSTGTQRMLMDHIDRLDREASELRDFRDKYYSVREQCAVLGEQVKKSISMEVMFGVCLTIGSLIIGYAPTLWTRPNSGMDGVFALAVGALLITGGIVTRVLRK